MFNFSFNGKAKRSEYWKVYLGWMAIYFALLILIVTTTLGSISRLMSGASSSYVSTLGGWFVVLIIVGIVGFVSTLSVTIRRCYDIGINPFWSLATFLPYIGLGAVLIFGVLDSNQNPIVGVNVQFGENNNATTTNSSIANQTSAAPPSTSFVGIKDLSNDGYKLYLLEKYAIKKNEILNKFVCRDKIFDTVDDAITQAAAEEKNFENEEKEKELKRLQDLEQKRLSDLAISEAQRVKEANAAVSASSNNYSILILGGVAALILIGAGLWWKFGSTKNIEVENIAPPAINQLNTEVPQARTDNYRSSQQNIETLNYSHGQYIGETAFGKADGQGTYTSKKGVIYQGQFVSDTFSGQGTMMWPNGDKFTGIWQNDSALNGTMTYSNGQVAEGAVRNAVFYPSR